MLSWSKRLQTKTKRRQRVRLETLESRCLLAVAGVLNADTLEVSLDEINDAATIREVAGNVQVFDGTSVQFSTPAANVSSISVAGDGDAGQTATFEGNLNLTGAVQVEQIVNAIFGSDLMAGSANITATGETRIGATISTTGSQTYNGPVVLTAGSEFSSTGNGDISFKSTINGLFSLT